MTSVEEEAAAAVVNGFLAAKTVEERLPFVRHPEQVEPLMREWYASEEKTIEWGDGVILLRDKRVDKGRYMIRIVVEFVGIGSQIFVIEQGGERFQVGLGDCGWIPGETIAEFKAERPTHRSSSASR